MTRVHTDHPLVQVETDAAGTPTTEPAAAIEGLLLPMAGPKGYVIAFMMDVLAGVLTGSAFGDAVAGPYDPGRRSGAGHLLLLIDVAALADPGEYAERVDTLVRATRGAARAPWADAILVPGEIEDRYIEFDRPDRLLQSDGVTQLQLPAHGRTDVAPEPHLDARHAEQVGDRLPRPRRQEEDRCRQ